MRPRLVVPTDELDQRGGERLLIRHDPAVELLLERAEEPFDAPVLPGAVLFDGLVANAELMKHAVEEENVVYPALREIGERDAADELTKEHGYVKQYLYELENMPNNSPAWIAKVREFRADIEQHMQEEEMNLFPKLRSQLSEEKNKLLTATMNKEGFKVA